MLDPETLEQIQLVQKVSAEQGWDLWESLERAGVILSKDRRNTLTRGIIANLLVQIEFQTDTALADLGGGQTVTGAINGVKKLLELHARSLG